MPDEPARVSVPILKVIELSGQPLDQIEFQLDPGACRITKLPDRVWLFGGQGTFELRREGGSLPAPLSFREAFWRWTMQMMPKPGRVWDRELDIPENHEEWWAFSGYDNLLTFERDACHLARAVVLFPESPGSFAELGALAVDDSIIDRLVVVVQKQFLDGPARRSFLNLGPLRRAEQRRRRCVIAATDVRSMGEDDFEAITEFLDAHIPKGNHTERLRVDNPTHRLLLAADLINLMMVAKEAELMSALGHFGVTVTSAELLRMTRLLDFFGLIRIEHRGAEEFFTRRIDAPGPWVDYEGKAGTYDRVRFKLERQKIIACDKRLHAVFGRAA